MYKRVRRNRNKLTELNVDNFRRHSVYNHIKHRCTSVSKRKKSIVTVDRETIQRERAKINCKGETSHRYGH